MIKNGQVLCQLANAIKPGVIKKVNDSEVKFKQMENISNFIKAAIELGVNDRNCFETLDLYEGVGEGREGRSCTEEGVGEKRGGRPPTTAGFSQPATDQTSVGPPGSHHEHMS